MKVWFGIVWVRAKRIAQYAQDHAQSVDAAAIHKTKTELFLDKLASDDLAPRNGVIDALA